VRASHRRFGQTDPLSTLFDGAPQLEPLGQAGHDEFFHQQVPCEDISACLDFDLQLLSPDIEYSLTPNNHIIPEQGKNDHFQQDFQNDSVYIEDEESTCNDLDISNLTDQYILTPSNPINQYHIIPEQGKYDHFEQSNILNYQEDFQNISVYIEDEESTSSLSDQSVSPVSFDLEVLFEVDQDQDQDQDQDHSIPAQTQKKSNKDRCKEYRNRQKEKKKLSLTELEDEEKKNDRLKFELQNMEEKVSKFKKLVFKRIKATEIRMSPKQLNFIMNY